MRVCIKLNSIVISNRNTVVGILAILCLFFSTSALSLSAPSSDADGTFSISFKKVDYYWGNYECDWIEVWAVGINHGEWYYWEDTDPWNCYSTSAQFSNLQPDTYYFWFEATYTDPETGDGDTYEWDSRYDSTTLVPVKTISVSDASISEGDNLVFTVTKTPATSQAYSVQYATAYGSAVSSDFTSSSGSVTFNAGQTAQTVSIATHEDSVYESNEFMNINLSNPSSGSTISDGHAYGTITNDDTPPTFSINDVSVSEGGNLSFTVIKNGASSFTHSVYQNVTGGSASADDYGSTLGQLNFVPGETSKTIVVTTNEDSTFEDDETVVISLSEPTNGATIADGTGVGTISNDDNAPSFSTSNVTVSEGNTATLTVTKSGSTELNHSVVYSSADGSADSSDYDDFYVTLNFAPGETSKTLTVQTYEDGVYESDEAFYAHLSSPSNGATIAGSPGTVWITNDDSAPSFTVNDVSVAEGGDLVFTLTKHGSSALDHSVIYNLVDSNAVAGSDYMSHSGLITFNNFQSSHTVTVTTLEDSLFERDETLNIVLSSPSNGATLSDGNGVGTILNDDAAPTFTINDISASEGNILTFTVTKTGATAIAHDVNYISYASTAGTGDFITVSGSLEFATHHTSHIISVETTEDSLYEGNESFTVDLYSPTYGAVIADSQGVGTIIDNDSAPYFTINDVSTVEGNILRFTISKHGASVFSHNILYETLHGSANGADYTSISGGLSFTPSSAPSQSQTVDVETIGDAIFEGNETLRLILSDATNGATISDNDGTGTIGNDDSAPNFIVYDAAAQPENSQLVFSVALSQQSQFTHNVTFATADGSASAPGDYTVKSGTVTFNPLQTSAQTISVDLAADNNYEGTERLYLNFTSPTAGAYLPDTQAHGDIIDNNCAPEFTIVDTTEVEGTPVKVWVQCQNGIRNVDFQITAGSASQGSDYTTPSGDYTGNLDFDGVNLKYIDINLQADTIYEANEILHVTLHDPADANTVIDSAIVTIQEDDAPPSFAIDNVSANEGDELVFTVTKTGATALSHSVNYISFTNTASDTDFNPVSGTLTFAANQTSQTIPVQSLTDAIYEGDEIFTVNLHAPSNAATISDSQGIGTITDDETPPVFNVSNTSTTEGQDLSFTITRDGATPLYQTVDYLISDGTAIAGDDYSRAGYSGTLVFQNGQTQHNITMATTDDDAFEIDETVILTLSNATDGAQLGAATAIGKIENNDAAPAFAINNTSGNEGSNLTFTISKTGTTAYSHSVDYTTIHGSADNSDYIGKSGTMIFNAGETSQTITINTVADSMYEQNESFTLQLSAASNGATISNATGNGLILNEDPQPTVSISDAQATEGNSMTFTITMTGSTDHTTTVSYATSDDTANSSDYTPDSGTLSFPSGASSQTVTVNTNDDYYIEDDERFYLTLGPTTGSISIADSTGVGTISNDDSIDNIQLPTAATDPANDTLEGTEYWGILQGEHHVEQDGSFSYSIPIQVPPGINGMQPTLALSYNSNRRNGVVGWGWGVSGAHSSISRCPANMIRDGEASGINTGDNYKYCLDGMRLVQIGSNEYRTESESFQKIVRIGVERVPIAWEVHSKDGTVRYYGSSNNSTINDGQNNAMRWYLHERRDISGNYMTYHYETTASGMHRIAHIGYTLHDSTQGTNHQVNFIYEIEVRNDVRETYEAGRVNRIDHRLAAIEVLSNNTRVRKYILAYQEPGQIYDDASFDDPLKTSRLYKVELCFSTDSQCAEPVTFAWTHAATSDYETDVNNFYPMINEDVHPDEYGTQGVQASEPGYRLLNDLGDGAKGDVRGDFDGDNLKELVSWACSAPSGSSQCSFYVRMAADEPAHRFASTSYEASWVRHYRYIYGNRSERSGVSPASHTKSRAYGRVLDLNGDGLDDFYATSSKYRGGIQAYISDGTTLNHAPGYSIDESQLHTAFIERPVGFTFLPNPHPTQANEVVQVYHTTYHPWHITFKDFNGDGLVDVLRGPYDMWAPDHRLYVAINNGNGFDPFVEWGMAEDYRSERWYSRIFLSESEYWGRSPVKPPRFADVNGDGRTDIVRFTHGVGVEVGLSTGQSFEFQDWGWDSIPQLPTSDQLTRCNGGERTVAFARRHEELDNIGDFNGDGKADLIYLEIDGTYIALSNGETFLSPVRWGEDLTLEKAACAGGHFWNVLDGNRDGISDLAINQYFYGYIPDGNAFFAIQYATGSNETRFTGIQDTLCPDRVKLTESGDPVCIYIERWDGPIEGDNLIQIYETYVVGPERSQIVAVSESDARHIDVTYDQLNRNNTHYTQTALESEDELRIGKNTAIQPNTSAEERTFYSGLDQTKPLRHRGVTAVINLRVQHLDQQSLSSDYHYTNLRSHVAGYGSLGFERIERTDTIGSQPQMLRTISDYHQVAKSDYVLRSLKHQQRCVIDAGEIGCGAGTQLLSETHNHWKVRVYNDDTDGVASPHFFPYLFKEETQHYDLNTGTLIGTVFKRLVDDGNVHSCPSVTPSTDLDRVVTSDLHFDAYGTPLHVTESYCDVFGVQGTRTHNTNISNDTSDWILGMVQDPYLHAWNYHADSGELDAKVRHSTFEFNTLGQVVQETREPNGSADQWLRQNRTYNSYGSVASITDTVQDFTNDGIDFSARSTVFNENYDAQGVRTVETVNALNQSVTQTFNARFGLEASRTDLNGLVTELKYDAVGRLKTVFNPDGTIIDYDYQRCDSCFSENTTAAWYTQVKATGASATRSYFDALGREVGTRTRGIYGDLNYTVIRYNDAGLVESTIDPFRIGEAQAETVFEYDILGRLRHTQFANGGIQTVDYTVVEDAAAIITTDTLGNQKTQRFDALKREKTIDDALDTRVSYRHDAHGNVVWIAVTPQMGDTLTHTIDYDLLGRKTALNDPDVGTISYTYNALGLLATQTNAENEAIHYRYDKLDRQTQRIDDALESSVTQTWVYDNKTHGIGLLGDVNGVDTSNAPHSISYRYNAYGLLDETTHTVNGESYKTTQHYDNFNRNRGITYPTGFTLEHEYSDYGFHYRSNDFMTSNNLWEAREDDARGNLTGERYGNGVLTIRSFDYRTGLVSSIYAGDPATTAQNHAYNFDTEGNLRSRIDHHHGITQTFCYDELYRLTDDPTTHSCNDVQGMDYSSASYGYDAHGNITQKNNISDYHYGHNAGPHAVTYANGSSYSYDAAGRMTGGGGRDIRYSAFGKPVYTAKGDYQTDIIYGALQQRIRRIDSHNPTGKVTRTVYVDKLYEKVNKPGQATEHRHYLGNYGVHIIKEDGTPAYTVYQHRDHIGSIAAKTDTKDGSLTVRYHANEPWGRRQKDHWDGEIFDTLEGAELEAQTYATTRGFTDHEHLDEVGLIHMNGRVYDPIVGRFVSPDPWIQDPESSQSFNRYSYVWNNPLRYTDPTGECSEAHSGSRLLCAIEDKITAFLEPIIEKQMKAAGVSVLPSDQRTKDFDHQAPDHGVSKEVIVVTTMALTAGAANIKDKIVRNKNKTKNGLNSKTNGVANNSESRSSGEKLSPKQKGDLGVAQSKQNAIARGEKVIGEEVSIKMENGKVTRADLLTQKPCGGIKCIESKNGPSAKLTPNQKQAKTELPEKGGEVRGKKAEANGFPSGTKIDKIEFQLDKHNICETSDSC